jgi:hypothetical protein
MQWVLAIALSIHVLAAMFWAGSTFALARTGGRTAETLFLPQMAAAVVAMISGGYLWRLLHEGSFGLTEEILSGAAAAAIVALVIQGWAVGRNLAALRRQEVSEAAARARIALAYRGAAFFLALTAIGMTSARYL